MTTIIYSPLPFLLLIAALIIRSRYNRVGFSNVLTYALLLGAFVAALIVTITQPPFLLPSPFIGYAWMPPYPFIFILAFGKKIEEDRIFIMSEGPIGFVNIEALKGDAQ